MIFRSDLVKAQWDTWCTHHNGSYYLHYLITEHVGEGFGVAISTDGVHWTDLGWAIRASDQMVRYLGTGSVWKAVDCPPARPVIECTLWRCAICCRRQSVLHAP